MAQRTIIAVLASVSILLILGAFTSFAAKPTVDRESGVLHPMQDDPPTNTPVPVNTDTPVPVDTDTPVPVDTDTPVPVDTDTPVPVDTDTPVPVDTDTPVPVDTDTPVPVDTDTPVPVDTDTPVPTKTDTPRPTKTPTPTNKIPWIDLDKNSSGIGYNKAAFLIGGAPVKIVSSSVDVGDPDGNRLKRATIKISNRKDGPSEELAADSNAVAGTNITVSYNKTNGTLTLSGSDTFLNYEKVLRTVTYRNTKNSPNTTNREVSFEVTDLGNGTSKPKAISTVKIVFPRIQISKTTKTPTINKGDTARFTITIENTGNVDLNNILLTDILVPDCDRTNLPSLSVNDKALKIDCELSNVTAEFINVADVTATDDYGNIVTDSDSVPVEILNPNIQIIKSPTTQTILRGERANFKIFVVNTSENVSLTDVVVVDPLVPQCDAQIGNLRPGISREYDCVSDAIDAPFINEITATGKSIFNGAEVQDGSRAFVEVLDMQASYFANPMVIEPDQGPAEFVVTVKNRGTVPFEIKSMMDDVLGPLDDPDNSRLKNNSCTDARNVVIGSGENFICHFTFTIPSKPGVYPYNLTVMAKDEDKNAVSADSPAELIIADTGFLTTSLVAIPSSLPAPGGMIKEKMTVSNLSADSTIGLETMNHNAVQGLNRSGICTLPQSLGPLGTYSCEIDVEVSGYVDEIVTHRIAATGFTQGGQFVGSSAEASILVYNPNRQLSWLPLVAMRDAILEEDNDSPCNAYPVFSGNSYEFTLDDQSDWYYFDVTSSGPVTIQIRGLQSESAQAAVYANEACDQIVADDLVSFNGDEKPEKTLSFNAQKKRHYLWIFDPGSRTVKIPYSVMIQISR